MVHYEKSSSLNLSTFADKLLKKTSIDPDARAQELSLEQWYKLSELV
ncbi:hypothetical protein HYS84_03755 [Candidatus Saccharibacteria bacterium]|nr:hypothetical protein [Candidatus Saccharibacteria bacterium]